MALLHYRKLHSEGVNGFVLRAEGSTGLRWGDWPGCPQTCSVAEVGLEFLILLLPPPKCLDYRLGTITSNSKGLLSIKFSIESSRRLRWHAAATRSGYVQEMSLSGQRVQSLASTQTNEKKKKLPFENNMLCSVVRTCVDLVLAAENNCSHSKISY